MPTALTLLDGVAWQGQAVPGDRVAALLAALASRPEGVTDGRLIRLIWADDEPANPTKALQVLVSRVRTTLGADSVERYDGGYRLGVPADDVDALLLRRLTRRPPRRSRRRRVPSRRAGRARHQARRRRRPRGDR